MKFILKVKFTLPQSKLELLPLIHRHLQPHLQSQSLTIHIQSHLQSLTKCHSHRLICYCSLFTNTVPTQNYECRISDSDKQAGKNDRDICKDTDKDSNTDLYRDIE